MKYAAFTVDGASSIHESLESAKASEMAVSILEFWGGSNASKAWAFAGCAGGEPGWSETNVAYIYERLGRMMFQKSVTV